MNLTEHNYEKNTAIEKLYSDTLDVSSKEIIFDTPVSVSAVTGRNTAFESGANYCIVDVCNGRITVMFKGYKYNDNRKII